MGTLKENWTVIELPDYLDCLSEIPVADLLSHPKDELVPSEYIGYARALIGQLMWVAVRTRPLLAYSVAEVSSKLSSLTVSEFLILKVVRQLRSQSGCRLRSGNLTGDFANWKLVCFADASLGDNADGTTQAGYLVFLVDSSPRQFSGNTSILAIPEIEACRKKHSMHRNPCGN